MTRVDDFDYNVGHIGCSYNGMSNLGDYYVEYLRWDLFQLKKKRYAAKILFKKLNVPLSKDHLTSYHQLLPLKSGIFN